MSSRAQHQTHTSSSERPRSKTSARSYKVKQQSSSRLLI
ncbi:hypothetical protein LINPERHAP1_LOCUS27171 [Linum perenne]